MIIVWDHATDYGQQPDLLCSTPMPSLRVYVRHTDQDTEEPLQARIVVLMSPVERCLKLYSLDLVYTLHFCVANIPTVEVVGGTIEAAPPVATESDRTDLGQTWYRCHAHEKRERGSVYRLHSSRTSSGS